MQIPFFCGTAAQCWEPGSEWALATAKRNLVNNYMVVGVTEQFDTFIEVRRYNHERRCSRNQIYSCVNVLVKLFHSQDLLLGKIVVDHEFQKVTSAIQIVPGRTQIFLLTWFILPAR